MPSHHKVNLISSAGQADKYVSDERALLAEEGPARFFYSILCRIFSGKRNCFDDKALLCNLYSLWKCLPFRGSASRGLNSGGNWNNGTESGRWAANWNNSPSNTNNNIGFRCALPAE